MAEPWWYGVFVKIWRKIWEKDSSFPFRAGCVSEPWLCNRNTWWAFLKCQCSGHTWDQIHQNFWGQKPENDIFSSAPHASNVPPGLQTTALDSSFHWILSLSPTVCQAWYEGLPFPLIFWSKVLSHPFYMDWTTTWKGTNFKSLHYLLYTVRAQRVQEKCFYVLFF